jgi:hypothetical protein
MTTRKSTQLEDTKIYPQYNMYVKIVRTHVSHLKNLYFSQPNFEIVRVRVPSW